MLKKVEAAPTRAVRKDKDWKAVAVEALGKPVDKNWSPEVVDAVIFNYRLYREVTRHNGSYRVPPTVGQKVVLYCLCDALNRLEHMTGEDVPEVIAKLMTAMDSSDAEDVG
jgi:hypothetical protein